MGALAGLKVLDLSRLLPGPYLTLMLADLGADVVKVEEPGGGDYLRHLPPARSDSEMGALFEALNRNKRSITLDLRQAEGAETFRKLLGHYDVVVESFRPGVLEKLGLGYPALAALQPRLILLSLSGWGQTGPLAKRAGHDLNYLSRTGAIGLGGPPEGLPAMPGVQMADIGGAMLGAISLLAALHQRERTGVGQHLDVALADVGLALLLPHLGARLLLGQEGQPLRRGQELLTGGAPSYGLYRTRDGRALSVGALEPKFWGAFCQAVGRPDLEHLNYATGEEGQAARAAVAEVVAGRTLAEWETFLADKDLCCEPVREGDEVLADAFVQARGFLRPTAAGQEFLTPLKLGEVPSRPAPALGQHTDEVLRECGLA
jgi:crotonobetainyl-CoA:carnitine CoA-transferase CaiB-like acyl-CoA transferase